MDISQQTSEPIHLSELKRRPTPDLVEFAEGIGIQNVGRARKQDLISQILRKQVHNGVEVLGDGTLEVVNDGYGFLRSPYSSYLAGPDDIYVSQTQIRRFNLRTGDNVSGKVRAPKNGERYFALLKINEVNATPAEHRKQIRQVLFENLTPTFPEVRYTLERGNGSTEDLSGRIIDLIAPIGKGQRALIVAPPKAGKTLLLQAIAQAISSNYPEVVLIVLLIDERPEEVTEMQRLVKGEVVASTFDEPATRHVQVSDMVIEKAKRLVEQKRDVVILLDSMTRLARAFNNTVPSSGKLLTGGVDANALSQPKRFFGGARNFVEGGSLSIIATALVDTGSRMDEVIYEEFKGTGNQEIHLERHIAEKRIYPAISIRRSATRREERLMSEEELQRVWILRKFLHKMEDIDAIEFMLDHLRKSKTNVEFFNSMKSAQAIKGS